MKHWQHSLAAGLAALLLTGCVGRTVEMGPANVPAHTSAIPVTGEACGFQLLIGIPIRTNSRLWRAYEDLKANAEGAVITDVKMQETWMYALVGTIYCTRLQAKAVMPARDGT